jgi:hypothetical protein
MQNYSKVVSGNYSFQIGWPSGYDPLLPVAFLQAASQENPDSTNWRTAKQSLATSPNRPKAVSYLFKYMTGQCHKAVMNMFELSRPHRPGRVGLSGQ